MGALMDVHGVRPPVRLLLRVDISTCLNGRALTAAHGMSAPVPVLRRVDILTFCSGHMQMGPWSEKTCFYAQGGHLETLQWARANGCPWDECTCYSAAYGGHLHVLQWHTQMDVPGMKSHVTEQLMVATLKCCSGCYQAGAHTIEVSYARDQG